MNSIHDILDPLYEPPSRGPPLLIPTPPPKPPRYAMCYKLSPFATLCQTPLPIPNPTLPHPIPFPSNLTHPLPNIIRRTPIPRYIPYPILLQRTNHLLWQRPH